MHRMIRTLVLAAAIAAFAGIGAACAPTTYAGCPANNVCLYQDHGFAGAFRNFSEDKVADYGNHKLSNGDNLNDEVTSIRNNTSKYALFYWDNNFRSYQLCLAPGHTADFSGFGPIQWYSANDALSSHQLSTTNIGGCW
ncbi:MAG TPA: peptidase inhibitor family I36 protein [Acidimicrobiia bacterium]|jgi:hypothetical protein|nr:peptidase inhibitor family I36 protein [Acidimicrobiia bacterium]